MLDGCSSSSDDVVVAVVNTLSVDTLWSLTTTTTPPSTRLRCCCGRWVETDRDRRRIDRIAVDEQEVAASDLTECFVPVYSIEISRSCR